jgi:probable HAF family extracellular repeat protein
MRPVRISPTLIKPLTCTLLLPVALLPAVLLPSSPAAAEPGRSGRAGHVGGYRSVVLFSGEASALGVNDRDDIVGNVGAPYATRWSAGKLTFLDKPGADWTTATAINDRGVVVGALQRQPNGTTWRAVLWAKGARRDLGFNGYPSAVNDHGVVVGTASAGASKDYAFRWSNGRLTSLARYGVRTGNPHVSDVNEAGQIAGTDAAGPFRLTGTRLERPPAGSGMTDAAAITERGDVIGTRSVGGVGWEAVIWTRAGAVRSLGTIGTVAADGRRLGGTVRDANDRGQVVGQATRQWADAGGAFEDSKPFVLSGGVLTFLPGGPGAATAINDSGVVIGWTGGDVVSWVPDRP